ncbi:MAG TPA: N-acetylmuramoyl-L-alanine amidase [Chthoniobacterales bacterium]|nr:N-acetylmuramoyl-L-alanine amidase [Chthoniobacterales bacterium]
MASVLAVMPVSAQVSSEEKPEASEKTSPTPSKSPSPKPKASPKKKKPTPKKRPTLAKKKKAKASSAKKKSKASPTPSPKKSPSPEPVSTSETPIAPSPTPLATLTPVPTVGPSISPGSIPQVEVEKSGFLGDQGYEPPPSPTPRRRWWFWSRPEVTYRYLSRSVRNEIDRAPVMRRRWQFIVVHNSGTRQGSARIFDYYHRHVRRMKNGLAYHFVIGNGTSTGDGQIEVGDRWRRQINGGHVHSDYLNNIALGICLVGDFNRGQPTRRQLEACEELINYLRKRCGKIDAHYAVVRPHREVNPPQWATDCPGDAFPYSWFRRFQE